MKILPKVLRVIKPTPEEIRSEQTFCKMLILHIKESAPGYKVVLTGSVAKNTFLRDKKDVDIFVLFDRSVPRDNLESTIRQIMAKAFPSLNYQLSYAEHPYVRFHFDGRRIDLVPAYLISNASQRISAVDRSVLHTKFVLASLIKNQNEEVILLKQFLRANSLYGAEIKTEGVSGYLCELLIIKYGTFTKLLRASLKWQVPIFIDIKKYYKGKAETEHAIAQFGSFTVIDPTDKNRNVAAAVSLSNLKKFIALSKAFLKKPSELFFFRQPEKFEDKVEKSKKSDFTILVSMPRPDIVDDVLWGQLRKMIGQLNTQLKDFSPKTIFADDSRHLVRLAIVLGESRLSDKMLLAGPPLKMKKHVQEFKKSHKKSRFIIKKKMLFAEVQRPVVTAESAVLHFFKWFSNLNSHLAYPPEMLIIEVLSNKEKIKNSHSTISKNNKPKKRTARSR